MSPFTQNNTSTSTKTSSITKTKLLVATLALAAAAGLAFIAVPLLKLSRGEDVQAPVISPILK